MTVSQLIHLFHWFIYLGSFAAFGLLLTKYRRYGAAWIALLFTVQTVWAGCPVTSLENYFRAQEGRPLLPTGMLTDNITSNHLAQEGLSLGTAIASWALVIL